MAVAADEANPLLHAILDRYGVLAGSRGKDSVARPFDLRRNGFVLAEGASAVMLETEDGARRRGVEGPLWTLRAALSVFDPSAPVASYGRQPERLGDQVLESLRRRGVEGESIDAVVCGASGSRQGDLAEGRFLRRLFDDSPPPIVVPAAYAGHHGAGLLAGLMWLLDGGSWAPTPGFQTPDPAFGIVPFSGGTIEARRVLCGCLTVGGASAWLILDRI